MFNVGDKVMYVSEDAGMMGIEVFSIGCTGVITGMCGPTNTQSVYVLADDPNERSTIGRDRSNSNTWVINVRNIQFINRSDRKTPGWKAYYNNEKEILA